MPTDMSDKPTAEFAEFYARWFDRVFNYARGRTGSATRADEIAADTFERAFRDWGRFDESRGDRRTWLFTIAFRSVADHYRSEKPGVWTSLELTAEPADGAKGPAKEAEAADEKRLLANALGALEDEAREVVSLRFFSGMTNRAIGETLGLSESNVAVILFRSIRKLRKIFPALEA
jgi:RNA polymerase sigma-70 factor (ECF subfamily)